MSEVISVRCYVEQYDDTSHPVGYRLREKQTGRRVVLGETTASGLSHFLHFIGAAVVNREAFPALFDQHDDEDAIVVRGRVDVDGDDELLLKYDQQLSYIID
ncbi:hypothetical protein ABUV18_03062 (plasmid) [Clavibacter nebraskensis]|uniref:hypothetical protein n=1 Tax=Clavibacter nebraskensis TaxID=31963 RepID=UPI003DA78273